MNSRGARFASTDYGPTDIVAERFDADVRAGEQIAKDMTAARIGPDISMAVVGSPAYFKKRSKPNVPQDLVRDRCINLRLPTHGGLYTWEFERARREMRVRVEGQVTFNGTPQMLNAALSGFGLAYLPEDTAQPHIAKGRLVQVLRTGARLTPDITFTIRACGNPPLRSGSW